MPDEGGTVRTLHIGAWVLPTLAVFLLTLVAGLSFFVYHSQQALSSYVDRSAELEALRFTHASQQAQLNVFAERMVALDEQITALRAHENELNVLTGQFNRQLGLEDDASLSDMAPRLNDLLAWAYDGQNGVGGSEQLASALSATAVAGDSREVIKGMHRDLDRLMMEADDAEHYIITLKDKLFGASSILAATPTILPLNSRISAAFGGRRNPFSGSGQEMHRGLDIPAPIGAVVRAPADGTVLSVSQAGGYGLLLTIDHGYGLITRYAHLSSALVEPGDEVKRGQKIARTGNSGRSTGPHLHYETVIGGLAVDPLKMLPGHVAKDVVIAERGEAQD
jgi:murein DD-endopeptidase MepM/ murein hydrolase activator NlpD